jgi:hypothetical protein
LKTELETGNRDFLGYRTASKAVSVFVVSALPIMEETSESVAQAPQNEVLNPAPTTTETATIPPTASSPSTATPATTPSKPIHSLVIDANAIINNDPTVSTLLAQADELYTIPAVVTESAPAMLLLDPCPPLLTED